MHFAVKKCFLDPFLSVKYGKTRWRQRRSPDPFVGWGGDTPPRSHPAQRLRRSILAFPLLLIFEMTTDPLFCRKTIFNLTWPLTVTSQGRGVFVEILSSSNLFKVA